MCEKVSFYGKVPFVKVLKEDADYSSLNLGL